MPVLPSVLTRVLLACSLVACQATPYVQPSRWCEAATTSQPDVWWQGFDDPVLLDLLASARRCNIDLAKKALEVRRYQLESGRSDLQWQGQLSGDSQTAVAGGPSQRVFGAKFSLTYELDLWQRLSRAHDSAAWLAQASQEERRALLLSLDADVAQAYWQRSALAALVRLAREDRRTRQQMLALTRVALKYGAQPQREVWQQQQALLLLEQKVSALERGEQWAGVRLAALLDQGAAPAFRTHWKSGAGMPGVASDVPVKLLERRPDVSAQQARLYSRLAALDVARSSFMPALSLTGSLGSSAPALTQWLSQPTAALLAGLSFPFLNWHNLSLNRDLAQIDLQSVSLDYRRSLIQAGREVAEVLEQRQRLQSDVLRAHQGLRLAQQAEREAVLQLDAGDTDRLSVYHARLLRVQQESALIEAQLEQRINLALLYKALGGAPPGG